MINEIIIKLNHAPINNDMFIHHLHVATPAPCSEQTKDSRGIHSALYPTIVEPANNMPPLQNNAVNTIFKMWEFFFNLGN